MGRWEIAFGNFIWLVNLHKQIILQFFARCGAVFDKVMKSEYGIRSHKFSQWTADTINFTVGHEVANSSDSSSTVAIMILV